MDPIITGVAVGVIMVIVNLGIQIYRDRRGKTKATMQLLLKCVLVLLCAMKKSGTVNGDCDDILDEVNEFLIKK